MGTALVTGASAGLGAEFAWQLATARHDLVLVARRADRLNLLADQIRAAAGVHVEVIVADLADRDEVERVADRLRAERRPVGLLVNNAGYSVNAPFVTGDVADEEAMLDVMVRAVLVLTRAAVGPMIERERGAILNVASVAALTANGTYSAAKAWVRTFTEGLAVELTGTGVSATVLCPGLTHTEFHEAAGLGERGPALAWLSADRVVAHALADVRRGTVISTPSLRYQAGSALLRVLPRSALRAAHARYGL